MLNGRWILAGEAVAGVHQNAAVALDLTTLGGWTALLLLEDLRFWLAGAATRTAFYAIG